MAKPAAKSEWIDVSVFGKHGQTAAKSWFNGLIAESETVLSASMLARIADDKTLKLVAIATDGDRHTRKFTRTFGRQFSITVQPRVERAALEAEIQRFKEGK